MFGFGRRKKGYVKMEGDDVSVGSSEQRSEQVQDTASQREEEQQQQQTEQQIVVQAQRVTKPLPGRGDFNKPAGMLIEQISNMTDAQRQEVLGLQGKLTAIYLSEEGTEDKTNLYRIGNSKQAEEIIAKKKENGVITDEIIAEGKEKAENQKGVPRDVPLFGDLAVKTGVVNPQVKDALMAVQAAERTVQASEGKTGFMTDQIKEGFEKMDSEGNMFARPFVGAKGDDGSYRDPENTVKAQATNHLADIVSGYIAAKGGKDNVSPEVRTSADSALLTLGIDAYEKSGKELERLAGEGDKGVGPEAAIAADGISKELRQRKLDLGGTVNVPASQLMLEKGLKSITQEYKGKSDEKSQAFGVKLEGIVEQRLAQVRGTELEKAVSGRALA